MVSSKTVAIIFAVVGISCGVIEFTHAMPSIGHYLKRFNPIPGVDYVQICLDNCVQCKAMWDDYFQGPTCARACEKFKGKFIPDCEDHNSIAPFLNVLE